MILQNSGNYCNFANARTTQIAVE